jgi:hypothetical protein
LVAATFLKKTSKKCDAATDSATDTATSVLHRGHMPTTNASNITTQIRDNWKTVANSRTGIRALRAWQTRHPELDQFRTPFQLTETIHTSTPQTANGLVAILIVEQRTGCPIARDAVLNSMLPLVIAVLRKTRADSTHTDDDISELLTATIDILRHPRDVGDWPITSFYNTLYCRATRRREHTNRETSIHAAVKVDFDFNIIPDTSQRGHAGTDLLQVLAHAVQIGTISTADASLLGARAFLDRAVSNDAAAQHVTERAMRKRHSRLVGRLAAAAPQLADYTVAA